MLAGCGSAHAPHAPERAKAPASAKSVDPPRQPWPEFAEVSAWPVLNTSVFRSRGHLVRPEFVDVRISAEARAAYVALVTDTVLPDSTTVALFFTDEPRRRPGPIFVMQKVSKSWRFFATDERGGIVPQQDPGACARCHRGATADSLFGLPRGTELAPLPAAQP